jgi:hypothetical protein
MIELERIKLQYSSIRKWSDQTAARARGGALHGKKYDFVKLYVALEYQVVWIFVWIGSAKLEQLRGMPPLKNNRCGNVRQYW